MIRALLGLTAMPSEDEADALAWRDLSYSHRAGATKVGKSIMIAIFFHSTMIRFITDVRGTIFRGTTS